MSLDLGRKIIVIGPSCSGKSTLGEELAGHLGLRFVELDALFWEPEWTSPPAEVFRQRVADATVGDGWVVAGNYSVVRDLLWPRADTVIWLDLSLPLLLRRMFRRTWQRHRSNELLWGTNREKFLGQFTTRSDESLFAFTIKTHRGRRKQFAAAMTGGEWPNARFRRFKSPKGIERLRLAVGLTG